jgi:hypothetical protein
MNEFVTEWSLGKSHENCKCFVEKFLPQSTLLSLVSRRRFGYVLLRLEADTDLERHRRRRILVTASTANCPRFLSIS